MAIGPTQWCLYVLSTSSRFSCKTTLGKDFHFVTEPLVSRSHLQVCWYIHRSKHASSFLLNFFEAMSQWIGVEHLQETIMCFPWEKLWLPLGFPLRHIHCGHRRQDDATTADTYTFTDRFNYSYTYIYR